MPNVPRKTATQKTVARKTAMWSDQSQHWHRRPVGHHGSYPREPIFEWSVYLVSGRINMYGRLLSGIAVGLCLSVAISLSALVVLLLAPLGNLPEATTDWLLLVKWLVIGSLTVSVICACLLISKRKRRPILHFRLLSDIRAGDSAG